MEADLLPKAIDVNNYSFIGEVVEVSSADALKKLSIDLSKKTTGVVVLCATINGKASVAIALAEEIATTGLDAAKLVKEQVAPLIKGGGGGSKTSATAGGQDSSQLQQVIAKVKSAL